MKKEHSLRYWLSIPYVSALLMLSLSAIGAAGASNISTAPCSMSISDAKQALTDTYELKTWRDVYRNYKRYWRCDNGGELSQNFSDDVAFLLSEKWSHIDALIDLIQADPRFEAFILHHIDDTMALEQGTLIENNAQSRCPSRAKDFCSMIRNQLSEQKNSQGRPWL